MAAGDVTPPEKSPRLRVLCVGIATLDIVNRVAVYPPEDSEVRASSQSQRLGGNAANTAIVLAQLGAQVSWVGNLGDRAPIVEQTFARHGVDASLAVRIPNATLPTAYITLSEATGTRSIVHYRDLPEYPAEEFLGLDLSGLDWVHFEGRAIDQLAVMLRHVRATPGLTVSLEVEKPRQGIEALFEHTDLLLFSHDYATARGFQGAEALLHSLPAGRRATCTRGAQGAWAIDRDGRLSHTAAPVLDAVVDTVGAGDVFNAAIVNCLGMGRPLHQALQAAVVLASSQCTRDGLELAPGR